MGMKEEILEKTAKEYFESAEDELKKGRYNSAVVLFQLGFNTPQLAAVA